MPFTFPSDLERDSWAPITTASTADDVRASKFGGLPYLKGNEVWPCCGQCQAPLTLFFQIHGKDLPQGFDKPWKNLLQLFYCTNDAAYCDGYAHFSSSHLVRLVTPDNTLGTPNESPGAMPFPAQMITDWTVQTDYPNWEERDAMGRTLGTGENGEAPDDEAFEPQPKDKLGGWPFWVQGVEYPNCPECGTAMQFLVQVDSEDHVPYMFGDVGCAHLTQCPKHPNVLSFGWACY